MTLTLNPAIRNIASARRLSLVNICVRFLRNPSRASRVTERKGKKVIWSLTPKYDLDIESSHPDHCFCISSQSGKHLCQVSSKSFKGFKSYRGEGKKSYGLWPLSMTLTLNPAIRNIASAQRLSLVNICVRFLQNPSRGSRVIERKGKKVIWPLTPKYDLDLESSHPEHCFCTSSQSG